MIRFIILLIGGSVIEYLLKIDIKSGEIILNPHDVAKDKKNR